MSILHPKQPAYQSLRFLYRRCVSCKMTEDKIVSVIINEEGQLHIVPESLSFPMIYRSASEVHWNNSTKSLYSPKPREWNYLDWYQHIIGIAEGDNYCKLLITSDTEWVNIPTELKKEIENFASR